MKKIILLLTMAILSSVAFSQQTDSLKHKVQEKIQNKLPETDKQIKTIFGSDKVHHGIYLAYANSYARNLLDRNALLVGGRLVWSMDHWFGLGFGGYGLTTPVAQEVVVNNKTQTNYFNMGYGGMYFEITPLSTYPVHVSIPLLLGVGGYAYFEKLYDYKYSWDEYGFIDSDIFLIAEPGAQIEINILKHMRLAIGANYRFTENFQVKSTNINNIDGFTYNMTLKFGWF